MNAYYNIFMQDTSSTHGGSISYIIATLIVIIFCYINPPLQIMGYIVLAWQDYIHNGIGEASVFDSYSQSKEKTMILYNSGRFSREKTFMNFAILEPPVKVFSVKFGHAIPTDIRL